MAALDDRPQTLEELARSVDRPVGNIEDLLAEAERSGFVVDWGEVWATTWRAKVLLHPRFFSTWLPASLGLGAAVTGLAVWLRVSGGEAPMWPLVLGAIAAGGLVVAAVQARRRDELAGTDAGP